MGSVCLFTITVLAMLGSSSTAVLSRTTTSSSTTSDGPVVQTTHGPVRGLYVEEGRTFYGIPFAAAPTGDLRWRPPQPARSWGPAVYDATKRSPFCIQQDCSPQDSDPAAVCPPKPERKKSEDCLYLNVFVPNTASPMSRKPVIFFIHGGNFLTGTAMAVMYDGRFLANKTDAVVVAANYRLSSLGFLKAGTGQDAALGNYGILDQIAAMQWIQDNIGSFGGDKGQVTLFGESSGAYSVMIHLINEGSDKLFHKAIVSSPPLGLYFRSGWEATAFGDDFAKLVNCTAGDIKCMRAVDVSVIAHAQDAVQNKIVDPFRLTELYEPWGPVLDGHIITTQMVESFSAGHFDKKPLIIGTNTEEGVLLIDGGLPSPLPTNQYQAAMLAIFRTSGFAVLHEYPPSNTGDERPILSTLATHFIFACPTRNVIKSALKQGNTDIWMYVYAHPLSIDQVLADLPYCKGRVCHGAELPIEFQSVSLKGYKFTREEQVLANSMAYYYGNFAHTSDPNTPGTRHTSGQQQALIWPPVGLTQNYTNLVFDTPKNSVAQAYLKDKCDFWDRENRYP